MFKAKRNSVPLPNASEMSKALAEVRAIQNNHDARLMLLVFLDRAALMGRNLKAHGIETDDSLKALFESALEQARAAPRKPPTAFNPLAETGKVS